MLIFLVAMLAAFDPKGAAQQGTCVRECRESFDQQTEDYQGCISECT